jgi:predicted nucleotidyltransferase
VDLLVDIEPERSLFDLVGAYQDLEKRLHFHVDMVTERGLKDLVRERVLREAVAL